MESTNLMQIFQDVYLQNISYCALCFRTEKETRLTSPLVFKNVLEALKYSEDVFHNDYICYMCEARANAVSHFVDMVHLALEVQGVFEKANQAVGKFRKKRLLKSINISQNSFNKMRKQTQYSQTDVLVVDAVDPVITEAMDAAEKSITSDTNQNLQEIETVIIDDETSHDSNLPSLVPLVKVAGQPERNPLELMQPLKSKPTPTPAPAPTPTPSSHMNVTVGKDGFLYLLPTPTITGDPISIQKQSPILENMLLRAKIFSRRERRRRESTIKIAGVKSGQVKVKPRKRAKYTKDADNEPSFGRIDIGVSSDRVDEASDGGVIFVNGDDKGVEYHDQVVKHPIRTDTKVDWEDKIPIDIISFVDSNTSRSDQFPDSTENWLQDLRE